MWAFDTADVRFEVEKVGLNQLILRGFEGRTTLFTQTLDSTFQAPRTHGGTTLQRLSGHYNLAYRGSDNTSINFSIDNHGNIILRNSDQETGFSARKSWGLKTAGTIEHHGASLFHTLMIQASQFHNFGILKAYTGTTQSGTSLTCLLSS